LLASGTERVFGPERDHQETKKTRNKVAPKAKGGWRKKKKRPLRQVKGRRCDGLVATEGLSSGEEKADGDYMTMGTKCWFLKLFRSKGEVGEGSIGRKKRRLDHRGSKQG